MDALLKYSKAQGRTYLTVLQIIYWHGDEPHGNRFDIHLESRVAWLDELLYSIAVIEKKHSNIQCW